MSAISLFIKLYRKKYAENVIIFILFVLLSAAISMVLFVQKNNSHLITNQLEYSNFMPEADSINAAPIFLITFQNAENVLGMIALCAIIIGAVGGLCLISFRNRTTRKAIVLMRIWGMWRHHIVIKALIDFAFFGVFSTVLGSVGGYFLFCYFTKKILKAVQAVRLLSFSSFLILLKAWLLVFLIIVMGNICIDFKELDTPITEFLYKRQMTKNAASHKIILLSLSLCIVLYAVSVFHVKAKYVLVSGLTVLGIFAVLFFLFHLFFGKYVKKKRPKMRIKKISDLSFCFLCSRNKQNSVLAIVISVGTVILCISANIIFNIGGMLRNAYRDNMGYTDVIFVEEYEDKDAIKEQLEHKGYTYTYGYSKLISYSELNINVQNDGMFWALIIEGQTDSNYHFFVPKGSFVSEEYFASCCNLISGNSFAIFGKPLNYAGFITDNQYLSLISYNIIVNSDDWRLGIDDSFKPVFIIDLSEAEERELKELLINYKCSVDSAAGLIDEIRNGFCDYIDIIFVVLIMLFIVAGTIFYTVVREDLYKRKTELYLYRIFGASYINVKSIILGEYVMTAFTSSFLVSFTVMMFGEFYFYFGIKKHFPLSIPIVAVTTIVAVFFVLLCCNLAGGLYEKKTGLEAIRDE